MPFGRRKSAASASSDEQTGEWTEDEEDPCEASQWKARDEIMGLISEKWDSHRSIIQLTAKPTYEELEDIGRLSRSEGILEFQKMIKVPVIHEEVATALWEMMATKVRQGADTESYVDLDDPQAVLAWEQEKRRERLVQDINAARKREKTSPRRSSYDPPRAFTASSPPSLAFTSLPASPAPPWTGTDDSTKPEEEAPLRKLSWPSALASPQRRRSSTKTNSTDESSVPDSDMSVRKSSWSFSVTSQNHRRSSVATKSGKSTTSTAPSTLSPDSNGREQWEPGFWQVLDDQLAQAAEPTPPPVDVVDSNTNPTHFPSSNDGTLQETTEAPSIPKPNLGRTAFLKRVVRKLSGFGLDVRAVGQSLATGYGSPGKSPRMG